MFNKLFDKIAPTWFCSSASRRGFETMMSGSREDVSLNEMRYFCLVDEHCVGYFSAVDGTCL